jgi:hypothetical protein
MNKELHYLQHIKAAVESVVYGPFSNRYEVQQCLLRLLTVAPGLANAISPDTVFELVMMGNNQLKAYTFAVGYMDNLRAHALGQIDQELDRDFPLLLKPERKTKKK